MKIQKSMIDMFIRLKNSSKSYKKHVIIIRTKQNIKLLEFLYKEGYILGYFNSENNLNEIIVNLKYQNYEPLIKNVNFISKSKNEVNCSVKLLAQQKDNNSLYIILTQNGYMSLVDAKFNNLGGQLICQLY